VDLALFTLSCGLVVGFISRRKLRCDGAVSPHVVWASYSSFLMSDGLLATLVSPNPQPVKGLALGGIFCDFFSRFF
jgi:hypothetical protein